MALPSSHLDKARLNNLADEIWKSAERLRGKFINIFGNDTMTLVLLNVG